MRISMIGTGYVGLVSGACFSEFGVEVICVDKDAKKIKTLAAGAIQPEVGFPYAFKGGADFICVGMYDFQVVEDVNLVLEILDDESLKSERRRPWRA